MSHFQPSEHSYDGLWDDAQAYVSGKYESAKATLLAPLTAATAAAEQAQATAEQAQETLEQGKKALAWAPWLGAGALLLGGYWLYSKNRPGYYRNPAKEPPQPGDWDYIPPNDNWVKIGIGGVTNILDANRLAAEDRRQGRYARAAGRAITASTNTAMLPRVASMLGFWPV